MPRIRTVKPEMWTDGKVVRLTDAANLLFIALLNQADDAGRLRNDPKEIECRAPRFWERSKDFIDELSKVGLVHIYGKSDEFLLISNFNKHQVIDRPRPSEFPSPNNRRTLADHSTQGKEWKGKERKGTIPPSGEFELLWKDYPRPEGKKEALKHFQLSCSKDPQAVPRIRRALDNYIAYIASEKIELRYVKMGSTWFNNWEDWENRERRKAPSLEPSAIAKADMKIMHDQKISLELDELEFARDLEEARSLSDYHDLELQARALIPDDMKFGVETMFLPSKIVEIYRERKNKTEVSKQ